MANDKISRAEKARTKYNEDKLPEQRRKFMYRIKKGNIPTIASMKKFGFTLDVVNLLRKEVGKEPLNNDEVKGQLKEKMNLMIANKDQVLQSVIPNVHVFEVEHKEKKEVKITHIDKESKITLPIYLECISHKIDGKSVELYARMLKRLLEELNYKKDDSIVPYLKNTTKVENAIETMIIKKGTNKGKKYELGSKKLFYQAISTGLHKESCPAFEYQMGKDAKLFYNTKTDILNQDDKEKRRNKTQAADYVDWEKMLQVANDYINDKDNTLENRTFIQVYTGLGGVPRTGTFLKLHVVKTMAEADDNNKNYYVTNTKTLISNNHKTGINNNKQGQSIIIDLNDFPQISKNMDVLAKKQDIIFNKRQEHTSPFFTKVFGTDNTELRHSHETWVHRQRNNLELIRRATYINAHSLATARDFYATKETNKKAEAKPKAKVKQDHMSKPDSEARYSTRQRQTRT